MKTNERRKTSKTKKDNKTKKSTALTDRKKQTKPPSEKLKHLKSKQQQQQHALNDKSNGVKAAHEMNATLSIKEMDELNDCVHEYLLFHGYDHTLTSFEKERISNGYTQIQLKHNLIHPNIVDDDAMRSEVLRHVTVMFDANDIEGIIKMWTRYLSKTVLDSNAYAIKIECHLHVYRFVTQLNQLRQQNNDKTRLSAIRTQLQSYFNCNGQRLALCPDTLPLFGLPFIDNAATHPTFAPFFSAAFAHNLRSQLIGVMLKTLDKISAPRLHAMFAVFRRVQKNNEFGGASLSSTSAGAANSGSDYLTHILRITSDFLNRMQYCSTNGLPPTTAMIAECKQKMSNIATDILKSRDTQCSVKRAECDDNLPSVQYDHDDDVRNTMLQETPAQLQNDSLQFTLNALCITQLPPQQQHQEQLPTARTDLDYSKIKKELAIKQDATPAEQTKLLLLLQSLRWRVTKLIKHAEKRRIVVEYIKHDILQCKRSNAQSNFYRLLNHSNMQIVETFLRLLNVISSFAIGRTYLLRIDHDKLVNILSDVMTGTSKDDAIRMNALGCLQKMSLRKELQDSMIRKGLIGFMIEMLSAELSALSEYTVEYSTALLMNLTLRTKGKKQCQLNEKHIQKILETMLSLLRSTFVAQIHTYVNGVLYSLLSERSIRHVATNMSLVSKLNECVDAYSNSAFKQQIDYIVSQLSAQNVVVAADGDMDMDIDKQLELDQEARDEDSDEVSNEDYSETEDYEEYDVNELEQYISQHAQKYVPGDVYLYSAYPQQNAPPVQARPVTPQPSATLNVPRNEVQQRMPKIATPNQAEKKNTVNVTVKPSSPRNITWKKDDEYRTVFEAKHKMARTPPHQPLKM